MNTKTAIELAFEDSYEAGKSSALAQLASGKSVLMVDEMGLSDLELANARGWNSVFVSAENAKLLSATSPVFMPGQPAPIYAAGVPVHQSTD